MLEFIDVQRAGRKGFSWERGLSEGWQIMACLKFHAQKASHPPLIHLFLSSAENFCMTCPHAALNMCFLTHLSLSPLPPSDHYTSVASHFWVDFTAQMETIKIHLVLFSLGRTEITGKREARIKLWKRLDTFNFFSTWNWIRINMQIVLNKINFILFVQLQCSSWFATQNYWMLKTVLNTPLKKQKEKKTQRKTEINPGNDSV